MDEDYDILPHKEIVELKKEIEALKKNPGSKDVQNSIEELMHSLNKMINIFNTAVEELKLEEKEESFASKKLDPIAEKLDQVIEQNKQIAEAIVAVVDMIKEQQIKQELRPVPPQFPKPRPQPFSPFGTFTPPNMPPPKETAQTRPSPFHPPPIGFPGPEQNFGMPLINQPPFESKPGPEMPPFDIPLPQAPAPKKKGLFSFKK